MKKGILNLIFGLLFLLPGELNARKKKDEKIAELNKDIIILNLVNGLYLTNKQVDFIIKRDREAEKVRKEAKKKLSLLGGETEEAYEKLKEELLNYDGTISHQTGRDVHSISQKKKQIIKEARDKMNGLVEKVKNALSQQQLYIIETYKPCHIPPKGPGRIGQAEGTGIIRQLDRIRGLPEKRYRTNKEKILNGMLERVRIKWPRGKIENETEIRAELSSLFNRLRAMSDADYLVEKEKAAEKIKEILYPPHPPVSVDNRIERFLLSERAIPILKEKKGK